MRIRDIIGGLCELVSIVSIFGLGYVMLVIGYGLGF
jgi:hypothetical protein